MTDKDKRMELPKITLDDLFTTQNERDAEERYGGKVCQEGGGSYCRNGFFI